MNKNKKLSYYQFLIQNSTNSGSDLDEASGSSSSNKEEEEEDEDSDAYPEQGKFIRTLSKDHSQSAKLLKSKANIIESNKNVVVEAFGYNN